MVTRKENADSSPASQQVSAGPVVDASGVVRAGQTDLDLLRGGRIELGEYLRRHAESATAHLVGRVSDERLADLRELLTLQALEDPSLADVLARLREAASERDAST